MHHKTVRSIQVNLGYPPPTPTLVLKDQRSLTGNFSPLWPHHIKGFYSFGGFYFDQFSEIFFPISLILEQESFASFSWSNIDSSFFTKVFTATCQHGLSTSLSQWMIFIKGKHTSYLSFFTLPHFEA